MSSLALLVLLVLANVFGVGMIVPQVMRLRRLRTADGLSGVWLGIGVALNGWWIAYAWATVLWGALPVAVGSMALYAVLAVYFIRYLGWAGARSLAVGAFGLGMVPLPFLLGGGWSAAGVAIGMSYGVQFFPAAWSAMRSSGLDGIAPTTWVMAWIEGLIWVIYGAPRADPALVLGGAGAVVASSIILLRLVRQSGGLGLAVGVGQPRLWVLLQIARPKFGSPRAQ